jgi:hypothetical protein
MGCKTFGETPALFTQVLDLLFRAEIPAAAARLRTLQRVVAFGSFACSAICTTCQTFSGATGLTRDGRVASFSSPSTPSAIYRRRQLRTLGKLLPHGRRNAFCRRAVAPHQHDPHAPNRFLRRITVPHHPLQPRSGAPNQIRSIFLTDANTRVHADL